MSGVSSRGMDPLSPKADRNSLARLIGAFLLKGKRLVARKKLPIIARRACRLYLDRQDAALQRKCQQVLKSSWRLNPGQLQRFLSTAIGKSLLDWCQYFFHWPEQQDPHKTLEQVILQMATDPDGLSLLTAVRHSPAALEFDPDHLLFALKRVEWVLRTTRVVAELVAELAALEADQHPQQFAELPDLRQSGRYDVQKSVMLLAGRSSQSAGDEPPQPLKVHWFAPSPWPEWPVPLIVQSHGLASTPLEVQIYAEHLASYGYCVMSPQHAGSDAHQLRRMLAGETNEVFELSEFVSRPADISYLLDELSQASASFWKNRLDLEQVGIIGHSFGAYTAFALAGANIQFEGLQTICDLPNREPNPSLLLQCQVLTLPRQCYQLQDSRVKAVLAIDSVGSEIFGRHGLAQIQVPLMLVAGSHDMTAPLVLEQMRIFRRLTTAHQYFVLMRGKSHLRNIHRFIRNSQLDCELPSAHKAVPNSAPNDEAAAIAPSPIEQNIQALSVAFFDAYLRPEQVTGDYLSAAYSQFLSQSPYECWLISDRSKATLAEKLQAMDEADLADSVT